MSYHTFWTMWTKNNKRMFKRNLPTITIIICSLLIIVDFIFNTHEMNIGFWLRIIMNAFLIFGAIATIREKNITKSNWFNWNLESLPNNSLNRNWKSLRNKALTELTQTLEIQKTELSRIIWNLKNNEMATTCIINCLGLFVLGKSYGFP